ncbi:molybdopterin molybdotransferase MoeA [Corynebacterium sp. L4756]|uniref:molybdopterin molybdotransferase MoeA n=1 Tax=unclassified Corynebacterium TaxID=2624378 RepID=UPI00374DBB51
MTSPESYREQIEQLLSSHVHRTSITIPIAQALGHVTANEITAEFDSPRFNNSQMDGYALPDAAGGTFEVAATIAAGAIPAPLEGKAAPIMTGAAVPADAVAIVPVEHTNPAEFLHPGETIDVPAVDAGQFIRRQGSDIAAGSVVIPAGTTLTGAGIATLASQSITEVDVIRPARILICTGGAEISVDNADNKATIPDANAPMLRAIASQANIEVIGHVRTDDDPQALAASLSDAITQHQPDAVVTSGGISAGKFEVVRQVLESADPNAWFNHVDQQPGGPQGMAVFKGIPFICLPGNPVSTLVSFRLFVAPILGHAPEPTFAVLAEPATGIAHREQFRRGRISHQPDGTTIAHIIGGPGSHLISQAVEATHLIRIPVDATLSAGDAVKIYEL